MIDSWKNLEAEDPFNKTLKFSRRNFITKIAILSGATLASCTPLKIMFRNYPDEFENNVTINLNKNQSAFIITVIPGADVNDVNLCKIFKDSFYGFENYCGFFISDLYKRSDKMFGKKSFYDLTAEQRTDVILSGLDADATLNKIYSAAILMSQDLITVQFMMMKKDANLLILRAILHLWIRQYITIIRNFIWLIKLQLMEIIIKVENVMEI